MNGVCHVCRSVSDSLRWGYYGTDSYQCLYCQKCADADRLPNRETKLPEGMGGAAWAVVSVVLAALLAGLGLLWIVGNLP